MTTKEKRYLTIYIFQAFGKQHTEHLYSDEKWSNEDILKLIVKTTSCPTAILLSVYHLDLQDLTKTEKAK